MTGYVPFNQYNTLAVIYKTVNGARPERPMDAASIGLSDALWKVVEDCWKQQPQERPKIRAVLNRVNQIIRYWVPPSPVAQNRQLEGVEGVFESVHSADTSKHMFSIFQFDLFTDFFKLSI